MSATLTIGKRRAGIPSERGSIEISLVGLWSRSIGEIPDALRETAARTAGFPHGVSAVSDSRSPPGGRESSRS
jgi:hypothetical protein